jgi:hypothetical protein
MPKTENSIRPATCQRYLHFRLSTIRWYCHLNDVQMVIIEPRVDKEAGLLYIKIPMHWKGEPDVTVTTSLDPTPDQLASFELVRDITIWGFQVNCESVFKIELSKIILFFLYSRPMAMRFLKRLMMLFHATLTSQFVLFARVRP